MYLVAFNQCGLELQAPQLLTTTKRRVEIADVETATLPDDAMRYVAWDSHAVRAVFTGLDPTAGYEISATYLCERDVERVLSLTSGAIELHPPTRLDRARPTVVRVPVPASAFASGTLEVSANRIEGPDATLSELRLYSTVAPPPVVTVVGDSDGGLIGSVSDAEYNGVAHAAVHLRWAGGELHATTDDAGLFRVPLARALPPGQHTQLSVTAQGDGPAATVTVDTRHLARGLRELPPGADRLDLAGAWSFRAGRFDPAAEPAVAAPQTGAGPTGAGPNGAGPTGPTTRVPGHIVFDGHVPERGVATMSRTFEVPGSWAGSAVFLRCDAAYGRAEVFVNGDPAGVHGGGATSFDLDLTPFLRPGVNSLAITLTEYTPHAVLDNMSWYAHMSLLGIWRPVFLFRTPPVHLGRVDVVADWDPGTLVGSLRIASDVINLGRDGASYRLDLIVSDVDGEACTTTCTGEAAGQASDRIDVTVPGLGVTPWSAEIPHLYTVDLVLGTADGTVRSYRRRVGFRRVEVRGNQLLVNGAPVRMLGMNRHDSRMLTGRALTTDQLRSDVLNLRHANMNTIRTSHYPADPRLLDICDEVGMYVFDQAPVCFSGGFDDHHWNRTHDAANLVPYLLEVTAETVQRDKAHACVLAWDLGNESRWSEGYDAQLAMVRALDPTRPSLFSYDLNELPENVLPSRPAHLRPELRSYHYPGWDRSWQEELAWLGSLDEPLVLDEFAPLFQECVRSDVDGYTVDIDPGVRDYWVAGYQEFMAAALRDRGCIGGMIWSGVDDVFAIPLDLRIGQGPWAHLPQGDFALVRQLFHGYEGAYFRGDAEWGVIDSWGRTRPELWHVQKMYSPVAVSDARFDAGRLHLVVTNRHSHRALDDLTVTVHGGRGPGRLSAAPGGSTGLTVDVDPGTDRVTVELWHPEGWLVDAYGWVPPGVSPSPEAALLAGAERPRVGITPGGDLTVVGSRPWLRGWPGVKFLDVNQPGRQVPGPVPDTGRAAVDGDGVAGAPLVGADWSGTMSVRAEAERVIISYRCRYDGPDAFDSREVGLTLRPPAGLTDLWWRRVGEWSYYPTDHIGRLAGYAPGVPGRPDVLHPAPTWEQDTTEGGSNDYRSTKRTILAAGATDGTVALSVLSDGTQHVRAELRDGEPVLHVFDWYGGARLDEGIQTHYFGPGRRIEKGTELAGTVVLVGGELPPELRAAPSGLRAAPESRG